MPNTSALLVDGVCPIVYPIGGAPLGTAFRHDDRNAVPTILQEVSSGLNEQARNTPFWPVVHKRGPGA